MLHCLFWAVYSDRAMPLSYQFNRYVSENGRISEKDFAGILLLYAGLSEAKRIKMLKRVKKAFKDDPDVSEHVSKNIRRVEHWKVPIINIYFPYFTVHLQIQQIYPCVWCILFSILTYFQCQIPWNYFMLDVVYMWTKFENGLNNKSKSHLS